MRSFSIPWHACRTRLHMPTALAIAMAAIPIACGLATQRLDTALISILGASVLLLAAAAHDVVQLLAIPRALWPEPPTVVPGASQLRSVQLTARQQWTAALAGLAVYGGLAAGAVLAQQALEHLQIHLLGVAELARFCVALALMQLLPAYPFDGGFLLEAALSRSATAPFAAELVAVISYPLALALGLCGVLGQPALIALGAWMWLATTDRRESVWASPSCLAPLAENLFCWSRTTIIHF